MGSFHRELYEAVQRVEHVKSMPEVMVRVISVQPGNLRSGKRQEGGVGI